MNPGSSDTAATPLHPDLSRLTKLIDNARAIIVTSHQDADGDSVGAQLAMLQFLRQRGKVAVAMQSGKTPSNLTFLPAAAEILDIDNGAVAPPPGVDLLIALECPNPSRMGVVWKFVSPGVIVVNIDHHADNTGYGDFVWVDPIASSVAELVWRYFGAIDYAIPRDVATCLYAAILTDTGRFRYSGVSDETFRAAGDLVARGVEPQTVCDNIYFRRSPAALKLMGYALSHMSFLAGGRACVIAIPYQAIQSLNAEKGDTEGVVETTLQSATADIGALIREETEGVVKVSLRSRGPWDVAKVAAEFGGGGHRNAAGLTLTRPFGEALAIITNRITALVENGE